LAFPFQAMATIRNLLFDLGNVIIDLDIPATENALRALLGPHMQSSFARNEQFGILRDYELGLLPEAEFFAGFRELAGSPVPDEVIRNAWNALLTGIPQPRLHMLETLRRDYQVFLLSNTNYTHLQWVYEYLERTYGITDFDTRFFDKPYYSHEIHLRKPDAEVYQYVLQDAGILGSETLFIDDNASNIEGAAECGLQVHHHSRGTIEDILPGLLS
jgi:FMN phosphatase YigB (HAD superfamily)